MKVRAKVGRLTQLTKGREYVVLGTSYNRLRILNDGGDPALYPRRAFDVLDESIPDNWVWMRGDEGESYADPPEMSERGFYERYFDGDEDAIFQFNEYLKDHGIDR